MGGAPVKNIAQNLVPTAVAALWVPTSTKHMTRVWLVCPKAKHLFTQFTLTLMVMVSAILNGPE